MRYEPSNQERHNTTKQPKTTKRPQHQKTKSQVRISEGLSTPKQKLGESGVSRGNEFVLLPALST